MLGQENKHLSMVRELLLRAVSRETICEPTRADTAVVDINFIYSDSSDILRPMAVSVRLATAFFTAVRPQSEWHRFWQAKAWGNAHEGRIPHSILPSERN